jgi:DNA replication protein DnaC
MAHTDPPDGPSRAFAGRLPVNPEDAATTFRQYFGEFPAPTADMDVRGAVDVDQRRHEAMAVLERTLPPVYRWARFESKDLAPRVSGAAPPVLRHRDWETPKLVFMGVARAGKTSLAVACLRRWVAATGRPAGFFHAYKLGCARIQHPAGRGEPDVVDDAMKFPLALIDDLGSERDTAANAVPDVIFARHAEDLPLWVTTGLTRSQLRDRYGAGIVGRLFERATVIPVGGNGAGQGESP